MCLIAFAMGAQAHGPLLIAANRDEFWQRPTLPLDRWTLPNGVEVCSGRDVQAGGTWLGVTPQGRVAMLTNVRSGQPETAPRSRGELVTRWLLGPSHTPDWPALVQDTDPTAYGGFNLVLGDLVTGAWVWLSNRFHPTASRDAVTTLTLPTGWYGQALPPGLYGLSNAGLDTPWPKTVRLKQAVAATLPHLLRTPAEAQPAWQQQLLNALLDLNRAPVEHLPNTGVPLAREQGLSSPFVHLPSMAYGTRSSLLVHGLGHRLHLQEWTHAVGLSDQEADAGLWPLTHSQHRQQTVAWG